MSNEDKRTNEEKKPRIINKCKRCGCYHNGTKQAIEYHKNDCIKEMVSARKRNMLL